MMTSPGDEGGPTTTLSDAARPEFNETLVRACILALWSDQAMAVLERDALRQVVDSVAHRKEERERFFRLALEDLNRHEVLADVERLDAALRLHLFDRCFEIVVRDRRLRRRELEFMDALRRRCGVGFWRYQRRVFRARPLGVRLLVGAAVVVAVGAAVTWQIWLPQHDAVPAAEVTEHPELLLPAPPEETRRLEPPALFEAVRRAVVTILVRSEDRRIGHGSGAVIAVDVGRRNYYVITNRHVVTPLTHDGGVLTFEAEFENGARFDAVLDYYSRTDDLALLKVLGTPLWAGAVAMRRRETLAVGEPVFALGSPMGLRGSLTSGIVSALRARHIQTDATVHFGSSGGPLFDASGLLCGVVTSAHEAKDYTFALYADAVLEMLAARREAAAARSTPSHD